eukprot:scaffold115264_cov45-Phaeocystis_antarctica.AAC.1
MEFTEGRVQHERPRLRVPAVPGRLGRGGGRVRGGGRRGVLGALRRVRAAGRTRSGVAPWQCCAELSVGIPRQRR